MTEYLLSTNKFKKPEVLTGNDARGKLILELLLLVPGHNQLFPGMGCNLIYYRHMTRSQIPELKSIIENQISTYLPECQADTVDLNVSKSNYLVIKIICQTIAFVYDSEVSPVPIYVDDANNNFM